MATQTTDDSKTIVSRALASFGDLSTLPEVTVKIIEVVENPDGTAGELHDVIKRDPALSAKLLKTVNSAFYGLPGQIANLDRAILMLGLSAVKNFAITASVSRLFKGGQEADAFNAKELWKHSVAVGVAAKGIAVAAGNQMVADEMFLAGLIHDLGILVERQAFGPQLAEIVRRCTAQEGTFLELEKRLIGATHQQIGEALTAKWKFPRHLQAIVGFHHNPETLSPELQPVGMVVHTADILCCQEEIGFCQTAQEEEFTEELLDGAGITVEQLVGVRDTLSAQVEEAEDILGSGA